MSRLAHLVRTTALITTLSCAGGPLVATAQPIYRYTGPDGQLVFTDRPPAGNDQVTQIDPGGTGQDSANAQLSFELRQLVSRFPVTLYTGDNCTPCVNGRAQLISRGIPFTEYTVKTQADLQALQSLSGDGTVPVLTIGSQRLKGYSRDEWTEYLDAAGYPSSSRLPTGYRQPPAKPLVPPAATPPASVPAAEDVPPEAPAPLPPPPANPSGIIF